MGGVCEYWQHPKSEPTEDKADASGWQLKQVCILRRNRYADLHSRLYRLGVGGASPVLNPLDSSGRAGLREYSQEKQGVPCRQVPSQLYLPYLNQSQSDDRGPSRVDRDPATAGRQDPDDSLSHGHHPAILWTLGSICVVIGSVTFKVSDRATRADVKLALGLRAADQPKFYQSSVHQTYKSEPASSSDDRQTDRREKPLCPGEPAALPRNAGGASWVSPLSLLLINLDSEAFYGALEDNFYHIPRGSQYSPDKKSSTLSTA